MSQGTPSREGRIERHLMRQRGAGVRAITADFGFSFALPSVPSVAERDLPTKPPAKRRRTDEPTSPKRRSDKTCGRSVEEATCLAEAVEPADAVRIAAADKIQPAPTNHNETTSSLISLALIEKAAKTTRKAPGSRRKLHLNDEVEQSEAQQTSWETRTTGLEDTFIFGLKPKKRKAELKTEEEAVAYESKQEKKKTAPRANKTTKAKEQLEDKLESDQTSEPSAQIENPDKKAKTTRKKTVPSKSAAATATETNDAIEPPIENAAKDGPDASGAYLTAAEALPEKTAETERRPVKTKPAPKKALKRSVDEVVAAVESMNTATPEKPTKRPRRQAAISAIEKVAMGYEDELIPVDKLRRAPDVGSKPRSRKVDVLELSANVPLSPPLTARINSVTKDIQDCDKNEAPSSPPVVVKRGRKLGVKATKERADEKHEVSPLGPAEDFFPTDEDNHAPDDKPPLASKLPAKRGRKPGSKNRKIVAPTSHEEPIVEAAVTGPAPNNPTPAKDIDYTPDDEPTLAPKLPAKRGRKPGSKNRKIVAPTSHEELIVDSALTGPASDRSSSVKQHSHTPDNEPTLAPKLPAKRGRKPGVNNRKITTIHVEPPAGPIVTEVVPKEKTLTVLGFGKSIDTRSERPPKKTPRNRKVGATERLREAIEDATSTEPSQEASKHSRSLAKQPRESSRDSSRKTIEDQPTKQRRALADFDSNVLRKSLTVEGKKFVPCAVESMSPARKQQSKPRKTKDESAMQSDTTTTRSVKAQHIPQFECLQDEGPSHETTATPKKRRVIAAEEDLDWLFEKPKSGRTKPATLRRPATKTRQMATEQSAKDMDLDDLLATVAGFSGKLLTGRRARVVAS